MKMVVDLIKKSLRFIHDKKLQAKRAAIPMLFLVFVTFWLRLVYLGYSDYQGDEIKAMYRPVPGQSAYEFLMDQRKGPFQFLVTAALKPITSGYFDNFGLRLPFALAGILSVFVLYKFVRIHFGKEAALLSAFLFSVNGFFVAFSRIVQYQSFTILFFLLALYFFSLALDQDRWKFKGWYFGAVFWGLSALAHYDAVFILPFVLYIYIKWFKKYNGESIKKKVLVTSYSAFITLGIMATFYVPFILQISSGQIEYWIGRVEDATEKISSSIYLFNIYNPIYVLEIYVSLFLLSLAKLRRVLILLAWIAFPLIFMELIIDVPGTHIYTYLIPAIICVSLGFLVLEKLFVEIFKEKGARIYRALSMLALMFLFLQSFAAFVDHNPEYPWVNKKFLLWSMNRPASNYHLSIFGFPYYRHWEEIGKYINERSTSGLYGTNERKSIPRFYLAGSTKEGEAAEFYIWIRDPQSFTEQIFQSKPYYWLRILKKPPVAIFTNGDSNVAKIYEMPLGDLNTLKTLYPH